MANIDHVPSKYQLNLLHVLPPFADKEKGVVNAIVEVNSGSIHKYELITEFDQGIVAGVPKGVTIAHKFGEREVVGEPEKQLHDCGIVYYPKHPYLICIMTRGSDFEKLAQGIRELSELVYKEIDEKAKQ
jgi:hypothetical protein